MKTYLSLLITAAMLTPALAQKPAPAAEKKDKDGWVNLIKGKTLKGWQRANGTAHFVLKDGVITGTTSQASPNSFLHTDKRYSDFELEFEMKNTTGSPPKKTSFRTSTLRTANGTTSKSKR